MVGSGGVFRETRVADTDWFLGGWQSLGVRGAGLAEDVSAERERALY